MSYPWWAIFQAVVLTHVVLGGGYLAPALEIDPWSGTTTWSLVAGAMDGNIWNGVQARWSHRVLVCLLMTSSACSAWAFCGELGHNSCECVCVPRQSLCAPWMRAKSCSPCVSSQAFSYTHTYTHRFIISIIFLAKHTHPDREYTVLARL